jgi:hypothetical protein
MGLWGLSSAAHSLQSFSVSAFLESFERLSVSPLHALFRKSRVIALFSSSSRSKHGSSEMNEKKELEKDLAWSKERLQWRRYEEMELKDIRRRAAKKLAKIEARRAKEYQELFPPTCTKIDSESIVTPDLNAAIMSALSELRADSSSRDQTLQEEAGGETYESTLVTRNGTVVKNPLGMRGVDAGQVSSHRGPPTDRPPDRPCICKGVVRGCLQERAGTRHFSRLAFFARVRHSLSGNATPLQKMQIKVWTPSDCDASIAAAGSSQDVSRRVRSWRHTSDGRSRVKRDTCVANGHPSSNLGRNLFPCGVFLPFTKSAGSIAQGDNRHSLALGCTPRYPAHGPLSGAAKHPAGARPSKCIIIFH